MRSPNLYVNYSWNKTSYCHHTAVYFTRKTLLENLQKHWKSEREGSGFWGTLCSNFLSDMGMFLFKFRSRVSIRWRWFHNLVFFIRIENICTHWVHKKLGELKEIYGYLTKTVQTDWINFLWNTSIFISSISLTDKNIFHMKTTCKSILDIFF